VSQPGLVPYITDLDLDKLDPYDRDLIDRALGLDANADPVLQEEIEGPRIKILMDVLGVQPVWARDNSLVYRMNYKEHVLIFSVVPDPEIHGVPVEVLERTWIECKDIPDLLAQMNEFARGVRDLDGHPPVMHPEDHPEEHAIGFFAPEANRVWLLSTEQVQADLKADNTGGWAHVNHLMQSNKGRLELAQRIAGGLLITVEEFQQHWASFQDSQPKKRQSEIIIDLMSAQLAQRFWAGRLKPKGEA
jgi:hypothetical protein